MTVPVIRCLYKPIRASKQRLSVDPIFHHFFRSLNLKFYPTDFNGRHNGIKGLWTFFKELKTTAFSGVADLHCVLRTHPLYLFFTLWI